MTESHTPDSLELRALLHFPSVKRGDDLAARIEAAAGAEGIGFRDDDILVIAQKIVSKAEGRDRLLDEVEPSSDALRHAGATGKDPRLIELILQESVAVVRTRPGLIITENRLGMVMANAGIDQSNVAQGKALLLPEDPDASAGAIREALRGRCGRELGIVIADSVGRAFRNGIVGHAIGVAGIHALLDLRGLADLNGRELAATEIGLADELAAAASLLMGQGAEGKPVVLIRGFRHIRGKGKATDLLRRPETDLFR